MDAQAGGAGGSTTLQDLRNMDKIWHKLRNAPQKPTGDPPAVVTTSQTPLGTKPEFDVIICGGTLGIFLATALQIAGVRVAVVERGPLKGRAQEWNVSRAEMRSLVQLGVFEESDLAKVLGLEFNPVRVGFKGGKDIWTKDVLNLGVKPDVMVPLAAERFRNAGGTVLDNTAASSFTVHPDGVAIGRGADAGALTARLMLDCMGHSSPIVRQLRHGQKPDGVCCVVGSLASGFPVAQNESSDLIYTDRDIELDDDGSPRAQYFWEAFPAGAGPSHRTTYMFSYMDADPRRPALEQLLEDYWRAMPEYQNVSLHDLQVQRILFGFFPTFRNSPLAPGFNRVLQVGDASGIQSPLSFGGFGALTRHLPRLVPAITDALSANALDKRELKRINAYNPGLSSAWMLQRAMSVRPEEKIPVDLVNRMLSSNFQSMADSGDKVMRPFLQDVMKFTPFLQTVLGQMFKDPLFIPVLIKHVGVLAMLDWLKNFIALGFYEVMYVLARPLKGRADKGAWDARTRYRIRRWVEALQFGSGRDH